MGKSDSDEEIFDPYGPEVLAANGIERDPITVRMMIRRWAYKMQLNGNLSVDQMIVPPDGVIRHLDLMEKVWGWWRLLPMYRVAGVDMPLYTEYLCEYYIRNPPESVDGTASAEERIVRRSAWTNENCRLVPFAHLCLEMEDRFMHQCKRVARGLTDGEIDLSKKIKLRARQIIDGDGDYVGAYAAAAALVCIAREAKLMREWVIYGQYSSSDPDCILSNQIREHALSLMLHKGSGSVVAMAGAAMVGAAKEAKLLCEHMRQDLCVDVALCDEIREETCAILLDLCKEATAASSEKNNIAAAGDGGEKSVARYLGSTISRINVAGKKEKKKHGDSKLVEKDKRVSAATDSHRGTPTPSQNTPASTGRGDLTARTARRQKDTTPVRARAPTPPPAPPETAVVTTETKIDMILSMVTGMAKDIAIIDERQKKVCHQETRDIGRDKNIQSEVSVGSVLSPTVSEFGDLRDTTPLHGSPRDLDDTEFTMVDFDFGEDQTQLASSFSTTTAPSSRQTHEWLWV